MSKVLSKIRLFYRHLWCFINHIHSCSLINYSQSTTVPRGLHTVRACHSQVSHVKHSYSINYGSFLFKHGSRWALSQLSTLHSFSLAFCSQSLAHGSSISLYISNTHRQLSPRLLNTAVLKSAKWTLCLDYENSFSVKHTGCMMEKEGNKKLLLNILKEFWSC